MLVLSGLLAVTVVSAKVALVFALLIPLAAFSMGRSARVIGAFAKRWQERIAQMVRFVLDLRLRKEFIIISGGADWERAEFDKLNQEYLRDIRKSYWRRASFAPLQEWFGFIVFCLLIAWVGSQAGDRDGLGAVQILVAAGVMLKPLKNLGEQWIKLGETAGALESCFRILEQPQDLVHSCPSKVCIVRTSLFISERFLCGRLGSRSICLKLTFKKERRLLLLGPSGCGKSTLLKSIAGLIPFQKLDAN